jgi:hypothetical protein
MCLYMRSAAYLVQTKKGIRLKVLLINYQSDIKNHQSDQKKKRPSMEHSFGVRKGAWTEEEDILLRRCVEKYGEGKWLQIPHRAGSSGERERLTFFG